MATFKGSWVTQKYHPQFVYGDVWTSIDFVHKKDRFVIKYNGEFQNGVIKEFETDILNNTGQISTYLFQYKTLQNQIIEFKATELDFDHINGKYTTTNPSDSGEFKMIRANFDLNQVIRDNNPMVSLGMCTIM